MELRALLKGISHKMIGNDDVNVSGLQYDSRKVQKGDLFFCIQGFQKDGHDYAKMAMEKGASCLMVTRALDLNLPQILVQDDRQAMAEISAAFYDHPADKMRMIGVTGTNGKTSITYFLKSILELSGEKVGLIGTISNMIGNRVIHTERTTPESMDLQKLLSDMQQEGVQTVVMEVSSHSLVLKRTAGISFAGGIFTNLTQDHLDFHGDFDHYAQAKRLLFAQSQCSAINADDAYGAFMKEGAMGKVSTYGIQKPADIMAQDIQLSPEGTRFVLTVQGTKFPVLIRIPGIFSVYNALAAATISFLLGIDMMYIKKGLEALVNVPGRFQSLDTHGRNFSVILDYAHTPDSLENTLKTAREFAKGRLVCVFGCGGNRDKGKRPIMGEISGRLADFSIVTSDNPRMEDPKEIIGEIVAGMQGANYIIIENRKEAMEYAIRHAKENDVILLAGKGHEDYQEICGEKHPFDEKVIVEEIFCTLDEHC